MTAINPQAKTTTTKQQRAAERIEGFGAEQRRLKEAATTRREAAAERDAEVKRSFSARSDEAPLPLRASRYLR